MNNPWMCYLVKFQVTYPYLNANLLQACLLRNVNFLCLISLTRYHTTVVVIYFEKLILENQFNISVKLF